ncbi:MAG TPA: glucose-6-phosphate isomerase [Armatimonadetes bacterium]|nr:glucose-6-phosphate isomerase [Armatimonadota bacterium]
MKLSIDYSHLMAANIGLDEGLTEQALDAMQPLVAAAHERIEADRVDGRHVRYGFRDLPETMAPELPRLLDHAATLFAAADAHVILGIGGSYLGGRMLFEALGHRYHNELPRARRNGPRIYFEGNGVDNTSLVDLFDLLRDQRVTLHVISKSGGTLETAAAYRLFREADGDLLRVAHTVLTTEQGSPMEQLYFLLGGAPADVYHLPRNVGGRYSVLSTVGLLPAAVMGLDPADLLAGHAQMRDWCAGADLRTNPAYLYAALMYLSARAGRTISVMAVWEKALEAFGLWYDQLSAESLGKAGVVSRTPLTAVCTRELHSRGQQHQEGTRDKTFLNLTVDQPSRAPLVLGVGSGPADGLEFVAGRGLPELNEAAAQGTDAAYAMARRPGLTFRLGALDAQTIGGLVYLFELATVTEGLLMAIDPLDQPGVQAYKDLLNGIAGNPRNAADRARFEQWQAELQRFGNSWGGA